MTQSAMDNSIMMLANPAINPPRLGSPTKRPTHSRSYSRSPVRQQVHDFDPLLRDLSPTTTLQAFSFDDPAPSRNSLSSSFETASSAQRALGAKAAKTCLDVRSWARELESWEWPGTFDEPEPARKKQRTSVMSFGTIASHRRIASDVEEEDEEFWGGLPAQVAQAYEQRADEIVQELDNINLEELKEFVLSAHQKSGSGSASIDDSIGSIGESTDLRRLDDFTAVITATILQALPYLSRLNGLLDLWTIRLSIARATPGFLHDLKQARTDMDHGWAALAITQNARQPPQGRHASFSRNTMNEMQSIIESKVSSLGVRLDGFLDALEGREETVPDSWIDDFETLESKYAGWVVQAERKVLENELKELNRQSMLEKLSEDQLDFSTSGNEELLNEDATTNGIPLDDVDTVDEPHAITADIVRSDSETLPGHLAARTLSSDRLTTTSSTSPERSRHVPIMVPYVGDGQEYPAQGLTGDNSEALSSVPALAINPTSKDSEVPAVSVKKRAAFLDSNLEANSSLQKQVKSPVRSFEHASNAFTRLFQKGRSPEPDRSVSAGTDAQNRRCGSVKREDGIIWGGRPLDRSLDEIFKQPSAKSNGPGTRAVSDGHNPNIKPESDRGRGSERPVPEVIPGQGDVPPLPDLPLEQANRALLQQQPKKVVETYKPRRLSSPFQSPDEQGFPENWPLQSPEPSPQAESPVKEEIKEAPARNPMSRSSRSSSRIRSPRRPMDSDVLERMFIDSLPPTPLERPESVVIREQEAAREQEVAREQEAAAIDDDTRRKFILPPTFNKEPTLDDSMLDFSPNDDREDDHRMVASRNASSLIEEPVERPKHIDLPPNSSSLPVPLDEDDDDDDEEGATPNSFLSDMSSPEIQDASVGYFHVSPSHSRNSSAVLPNTSVNQQSTNSERRQSPQALRLKIPPSPSYQPETEAAEDLLQVARPSLLKRASVASIESHPRSELKSVDITRRGSYSSASSSLQTPRDLPPSPTSFRNNLIFPTPPTGRVSESRSPVSPLERVESPVASRSRGSVSSPLATSPDARPATKGAPLNVIMTKRRGKENAPSITVEPKLPPRAAVRGVKGEGDTFDRHVSEVLESLPSQIRFKTRPGAETPLRTSEPRNYAGPRPKPSPRVVSRSSAGALTLAPAEPSPKKSSSASDPEVKLYHLTQAGREEPIKLFVRLVGENERVMVRVGGGWADLADYLKQYAEHHGSRTVSQSNLQVETVDSAPPTGLGNRRTSGLAASEVRSKGPNTPSRPSSKDKDSSTQLPEQDKTNNVSSSDEEERSPTTYAPPPIATPTNVTTTQRSTPKSTSTKGSSRPSTSDASSRPQSRQQGWAEVGMAGPGPGAAVPKKGDLSAHKAKWVEGMLEKAKKASAEKSKEDRQKHFGELGKIGGTRRVIFRSSSAAAINEGENGDGKQ